MGMFLRRGLAGRIALNITETGTTGLSKTQGYVTVGGTKYFSSTTLELTRGSVVEIYVGSTNSTSQRDLISKSMEKLCKPEVEHIGMS